MRMVVAGEPKPGTFRYGIHPPERKQLAEESSIEVLPTPAQVRVPLLQHLGAPCEAAVNRKDLVQMGAVLGTATGFVSAPVHSPIRGKVVKTTMCTLPNGRHVPTVPVKADGEQVEGDALWEDIFGGEWPTSGLDRYQPEEIVRAVQAAGIVGMGGAAFPTHVKLTQNPDRSIDTLLVNGCECEPYLTADDRLAREVSGAIITGAMLAARAAGAEDVVVALEDNTPQAIATMRETADGTGIRVMVMKTKYPQGGERQLTVAALGRVVPTGGLPLDVGVVVINVGTAAAVARAVIRGKPLTHRIVSVTGGGLVNPKNLLAPVGVSYGEVVDFCGGCTPEAVRVVAGGPMMGFALGSLDVPLTKGTSGITVLTRKEVRRAPETSCIRCGRCVEGCPLDLVPTKIAMASRHEDWDLARRYHITACIECGCCAYQCPANIPLTQLIRMGKAMLPAQ